MLAPAAAWDPCEAAPTIHVAPQVSATYDSNWARSSKELADLRGLKLSDIRYAPGVSVDAEMPFGPHVLFSHGEIGYEFYQRNDQLNRERLIGNAGARVRFSRCRATISGGFSRMQSDLADLATLDTVKNVETGREIGFDGRCGGPVGLMPLLAVKWAKDDNSADELQLSDNRSLNVRGGVAYTRGSFGELSLIAETTRVRYPHRDLLSDELSDSYRSYSFGARYERKLGSRISGTASLFRTTVHPAQGSRKFSGVTANLDLNWAPTPLIKTKLSLAREIQPASLAEADYIVVSRVGLAADYSRGPRLSFTAGAGLDKRDLKGEQPTIIPFQIVSDRRHYGYLGANYRFSRMIALHGEVRREIRNADIDAFDYKSNRATINLRLAF